MFGLASRYGSYEVTYKALTYPPHTFDDPKIEKQKMVVDAEDNLDAKRVAENILKKQGYKFNRIYDSKLIKYKVKENVKPDTNSNNSVTNKNVSSDRECVNDSTTSTNNNTNSVLLKALLFLSLGIIGFIVIFFVGTIILESIFL